MNNTRKKHSQQENFSNQQEFVKYSDCFVSLLHCSIAIPSLSSLIPLIIYKLICSIRSGESSRNLSNARIAKFANCSVRQVQRLMPRIISTGIFSRVMVKDKNGADNVFTYSVNWKLLEVLLKGARQKIQNKAIDPDIIESKTHVTPYYIKNNDYNIIKPTVSKIEKCKQEGWLYVPKWYFSNNSGLKEHEKIHNSPISEFSIGYLHEKFGTSKLENQRAWKEATEYLERRGKTPLKKLSCVEGWIKNGLDRGRRWQKKVANDNMSNKPSTWKCPVPLKDTVVEWKCPVPLGNERQKWESPVPLGAGSGKWICPVPLNNSGPKWESPVPLNNSEQKPPDKPKGSTFSFGCVIGTPLTEEQKRARDRLK